MKAIFNNIFVLSIITFMLGSCKKEETKVVAGANPTAPKLSVSNNLLVLTDSTASNDATTFSWGKTDFGYNAAVTYSIQFGKKDSNFVNPQTIGVGASLESKFTVGSLNVIANKLKLAAFTPGVIEARVVAEIGGGVSPVYSNTVTLTVTPYLDKPPYQTLYLVGSSTEGVWDNNKATPAFRDPANPFLFTYTGFFNVGEFKYLSLLGSWADQWGITDGKVFHKTGSLPDPGTIKITEAGHYKAVLDLGKNTFSIEKFDASAATAFPSLGISGDFDGWPNPSKVIMTRSTIDPHIWQLDFEFLADAQFKIKKTDDWGVAWGAVKGKESELYGIAGGENFKVKKGKYKIVFNTITNQYLFITQ